MTTEIVTFAALILAGAPATAESSERAPREQSYQAALMHMGVSFKIVLYEPDEATANRGFAAAFARIKQLDDTMSDYKPDSELSRLSQASPTAEPIKISRDMCRVLQRAQFFSQQSDGAFDVTVGPLTKLWRRAHRQKELPPADQLAEALSAVGYKQLRLDTQQRTVELLRPNMRLDLGGIAKGFACDEALAELRKLGIRSALVDGSGDIAIGDAPPGQSGWKIGVAPLQPDAPPSRFLALTNCAIATSGDAWQFVEIAGKRYSHIVDPRTGLGLTDHSSVTIVAPDCTTADALASAISVLGPQAGLALAESSPGVAALIVRAPQGKSETHESRRFAKLPVWSDTPRGTTP
jgi:thiamine biosynthesis lipoprotein